MKTPPAGFGIFLLCFIAFGSWNAFGCDRADDAASGTEGPRAPILLNDEAVVDRTGEATAAVGTPETPASPEPAPVVAESERTPPAGGGMQMDHESNIDEADVDPADIIAQPGASVGDITRCPMSGMLFRVEDTSAFSEYQGQNVYFCCAGCIRRFERNPEAHL